MDQQNSDNRKAETELPNDLLNDLFVEEDTEIKGGRSSECPAWRCGFNQNETVAEDDDAEETRLADLQPTEAELDATSGGHGVSVLAWARVDGISTSNHNETAMKADEAAPEVIADLPMEDDDQVKACGSGGGGAGKPIFQDIRFTTKVA